MNISFTFKNFEPSEHLKKYARKRIEKIERFAGKQEQLTAQVTLSVDKVRKTVEVQLTGQSVNITASEKADDMYATIDLITHKLESQLKRQVGKIRKLRNDKSIPSPEDILASMAPANDVADDYEIIQSHNYHSKPITLEEAASELVQGDQMFVVFLNAQSKRVNVLYRRNLGNLGLIDPQI